MHRGIKNYQHGSLPRVGVLLVNLGTPDAPRPAALKPYLKEFLSDPRVVDAPRLQWWFILNWIVLLRRPKSSAEAYEQIWTDKGSPLLAFSRSQAQQLQDHYRQAHDDQIIVELGMTYGQPSVSSALRRLQQQNVEAIIVLPLYPQYSGATSGSVFDVLVKELGQWRRVPALTFIDGYYDEPLYIQAVADSITAFRRAHGTADKLIFSYHGLPRRYLESGDPYYCHCHKTTRLIVAQLGLGEDDYLMTFQSRFGKETWLQPYTDETLKSLPARGVRSVQVVTPGFASDCVETLEEIDIRNREFFESAGGERFEFIPSLNATPAHIHLLTQLIDRHLQAYLNSARFDHHGDKRPASLQLATQQGADQ